MVSRASWRAAGGGLLAAEGAFEARDGFLGAGDGGDGDMDFGGEHFAGDAGAHRDGRAAGDIGTGSGVAGREEALVML